MNVNLQCTLLTKPLVQEKFVSNPRPSSSIKPQSLSMSDVRKRKEERLARYNVHINMDGIYEGLTECVSCGRNFYLYPIDAIDDLNNAVCSLNGRFCYGSNN